MKNVLTKLLASTLAFVLCAVPALAGTISVGQDSVSAIYDYSKFANSGSFSSVKDLVNDKETRVYTNMRISGHYSTDGTNSFIKESETFLNGNGVTTMTHDVINNTYQEFNQTGQITKAYSTLTVDGKQQTYSAAIDYGSDGSYTIGWQGTFKDDSGTEHVGTKSVEHYAADGRITDTTHYTWDSTRNTTKSDGKTIYTYNAAQNALVSETTYTGEGKVASQTSYQGGRQNYQTTWEYDDSGKCLGSYKSAQFNYSGQRLASVTNYSAQDLGKGTGKLASTTVYDNFGRQSYTTDSIGRVTDKMFYNDTAKSQTMTLSTVENGSNVSKTVNVVAGGVLYSQSTVYNDTPENPASNATFTNSYTLYYGGSSNTPAISGTAKPATVCSR